MNKLIQLDRAILEYLTLKYGKNVVQSSIKKIQETKIKKKL